MNNLILPDIIFISFEYISMISSMLELRTIDARYLLAARDGLSHYLTRRSWSSHFVSYVMHW